MRRRNFPIIIIMFAVTVFLSLVSNVFQPRSIETVMIVSGAGIEKSNDGNIRLSIQVIKPVKSDSGSSVSSCFVFSGEGESMSEATEKIIAKSGTVPAWSHCEVIVISKEIATEQDISFLIDPFFRANEVKNSTLILLSDESPEKILNAQTPFDSVSAFGIRRLLDDMDFESNRSPVTLKDFMEDYYSLSGASVIQSLSTEEIKNYTGGDESSESGKTTTEVILSSPSIVKNGKLSAELSPQANIGSKWLKNEIKGMMMSIGGKGGNNEISLILYSASAKLKAEKQDDKYVLKVTVKAEAEITSVLSEDEEGIISEKAIAGKYDSIRESIQNEIKNQIYSAWEEMISTDTDFSGIAEQLYAGLGHEWLEKQSGFGREMLENTVLKVDVKISISSGGLNKRYGSDKIHNFFTNAC